MKYYELDKDEQQELKEIEDALERGELHSVPDFAKRKAEAQQAARNTLNKPKDIDIRLSKRALHE